MVWSLAVAAQYHQFGSLAISPSGNLIVAYTTNNWYGLDELFYIFNSADGSVFDSKKSYSGSYHDHDYFSRSLLITDSGVMIAAIVESAPYTCINCNG
jgi:hypothetical protein